MWNSEYTDKKLKEPYAPKILVLLGFIVGVLTSILVGLLMC